MIFVAWARQRGFDLLLARADLKRLARRLLRCAVLAVSLSVTVGFLFFPQERARNVLQTLPKNT